MTTGARTRVLHVVPDLRVGGAERHVTTLMPGLDTDRFAASVICIGERGDLFDDLVASGVPATALGRTRRQAVRTLIDLVRAMRRERPDVVMTRGYNADMLGRVAAIIARVPHRFVWIHHHAEVDDRPRARRIADRLLERHTTGYLGVAHTQRSFLVDTLGFPATKVRIIHNGVNTGAFGADVDTGAVGAGSRDRAVLRGTGIEHARTVIGTVSAMRPEKDHPTLLRAAAIVMAADPGVALLVVGDGPQRVATETLAADLGIADRTAFVGSRSDIGDLLRAIDVFTLSSSAVECLPMALLEAMAAGVPAVATAVGGVGEMIVDGVTGHLVPPSDPAALAARLGDLVADPERATTMGAAARARAVAEFGLDTMIARTEAVLDDVATPARPPVRLTVVMDLTFVGGAEKLLLALFATLDRTRVRPRIICLREEGPLAADFRAMGVEVELMPPASARDPRRVISLARRLRGRTDVVLVAHHHRAALALGRLAAGMAGVPSVIAAHDMDLDAVGRRVLPRSAVATLRASRALILLSGAQGRYLHRAEGVSRRPWSRTREVVIANGIDLPPAPSARRRADARTLLGVDVEQMVVGIVARLSPQKAHETLFAAFEKCVATLPSAVLVVIGTGPREDELRRLAVDRGIADRVRFLGVRDDVVDLLPGLDVSCLSSLHEGVPMVLMESMAAGVPVVATDCGSVTDLVTDGTDGRVVDVSDSDSYADRLIEVGRDEELRHRMGAAGRATAEARFSIEETARGYTNLMEEIAFTTRPRTRI